MQLTQRIPEPEVMDGAEEALAYRQADFSEVNRRFADRFTELWRASGSRVTRPLMLDLGCGPADISVLVHRNVGAGRVLALDASEAMLREGMPGRRAAGAEFDVAMICGDAKRLPLPDAAFDAVFSNSLIHHLPDPVPMWREVKRVARPGAAVLFRDLLRPPADADAAALVDLYASQESPLLRRLFHDSLRAAFTVTEVRGHLRDAGLAGLAVEQVTDRHWDVLGRMP